MNMPFKLTCLNRSISPLSFDRTLGEVTVCGNLGVMVLNEAGPAGRW